MFGAPCPRYRLGASHRLSLASPTQGHQPARTAGSSRLGIEDDGGFGRYWHHGPPGVGASDTISVIAEVELKQEDQKFAYPPWIGKEVTGNEFYKKINLAAARRATRASTAVQE